MENSNTVCCMCGDVGFPDRLLQCMRCLYRFQHSYCSNYYVNERPETISLCDWCLSEQRNTARPKNQAEKEMVPGSQSEYSGINKIRQSGDREENGSRGRATSRASSSKPSGRRYKLLKDVLC